MPTILLVEDEPAIAETLIYALTTEGFTTEWLSLGQAALARLKQGTVDLVVLDVGLPDQNGFDVCRELRRFSEVPVLFLTARTSEVDRIVGLEIGGDDYVAKPFSPREVAARVRTILKRTSRLPSASSPSEHSKTSCFDVDLSKGKASFCGATLKLTRYELMLLGHLLAYPERILSRAQLMDAIWGDALDSDERTVDTHIKTLRSKLRSVNADLDPIQTHRGMGYSISVGSSV